MKNVNYKKIHEIKYPCFVGDEEVEMTKEEACEFLQQSFLYHTMSGKFSHIFVWRWLIMHDNELAHAVLPRRLYADCKILGISQQFVDQDKENNLLRIHYSESGTPNEILTCLVKIVDKTTTEQEISQLIEREKQVGSYGDILLVAPTLTVDMLHHPHKSFYDIATEIQFLSLHSKQEIIQSRRPQILEYCQILTALYVLEKQETV